MSSAHPARLFVLLAAWLALAGTSSALNVSLLTPFSWQNASSVSLNYSIDGNASSCALYTNESGWSAAANASFLNASNNSFSHNFTSGMWRWSVGCADGNATVFAANGTLGVDLLPPPAPLLSVSGYNASWSASGTDALSGFSRFELYRNNTLAFNTSNASVQYFMDLNSSPNASYAYRLDVVDVAGNRNSSTAVFEPLTGLSGLSVVQVAPRIFNVSWQTAVPANESAVLSPSVGLAVTYSSAALALLHSVNMTTPLFGPFNVTVSSCLRACFNQTAAASAAATINTSMVFYNATYNNAKAVLSVRWDSLYGLTFASISTNNSGTMYPVLSSTLPGSSLHSENLSFIVNGTARQVTWSATAVDRNGDSVSSTYSLLLNPDVALPVEPASSNVSFVAMAVGRELNLSNGFRLRLSGISSVPMGPSNRLSALMETYAPSGELEARFTAEEYGGYNTSAVAVQLYRVFVGLGNASYAEVHAYALSQPDLPTPTPEASASATPTPEPSPLPDGSNRTNASANVSLFSGRIVQAQVRQAPRSDGSIFSGYVLAADDSAPVFFNSTYEHSGNATRLFLLIRVKDPASNKTVLVARSRSHNASDGKALYFSTDSVSLAPGDYVADALVVSEANDQVMDSRVMTFAVQAPGASDALLLVGLFSVLALGVFVFALKINHHKTGLLP